MIYILTIKKHYNQRGIHPSLKAVRSYISRFGQNDLLICWPGYLSTNIRTAKAFQKRFPLALPKGSSAQKNPCFFFSGNNGNCKMNGLSSTTTIAKFINNLYNGFSSSYCTNDDHSKIIAFCEVPQDIRLPYGSKIDGYIDDIMDKKIKVKALLIGSSNHSHSTMTKISPDKKGECDVFLFDGNFCNNEKGANEIYYSLLDSKSDFKANVEQQLILSVEIHSSFSLNDIFKSLIKPTESSIKTYLNRYE